MKGYKRSGWASILEPVRVFVILLVVVVIYLLPLGEQPEFIERNGEFIEIPRHPPILEPFYPERITASCNGGPGFNCNTGCCRDDQCVKCPEEDPTLVPIRPPTISASLDCGSSFNGWCASSLALDLTASDPYDKAVIISGSINGIDFACPAGATSCSLPITDQGSGPITYRVDSATGASANGSMSYQLDFTTPQLDGWLSGVPGSNGWYVSNVDLSASASDSVSGLAAFDMSIDGGSAIQYTDTTFSDGIHTVTLSAMDHAGNYSETTLAFNIDTLTPSLNVSISGTVGAHRWYTSKVQVTPSANDAGSGVSGIEVSKDGAAYVSYASPLVFTNGHHSWQFRVIDNAGNVTESPIQEAFVDVIGPDIQLMQETSLGETLYYEVQDDGSELARLQFVIEDEDERFQKVVWEEDISGDYYDGGVLWDGKFKDGTQAPTGTYSLTIKASDTAGNESRKSGLITVGLFSFLQDIPPFDPSQSPLQTGEGQGEGESLPNIEFGGAASDTAGERTTQSFTKHPVSATPQPAPLDPAILLGVGAAAAVAAFVAEAEKKRKEDAARAAAAKAAADAAAFAAKMEEEGQKNDHLILSYKQRGQAFQAALDNFNANLAKAEEMGMSETEAQLLKDSVASSGTIGTSLGAAQEFIVKKQIEAAQFEAALQAYHEGEQQNAAADAWLAAQEEANEMEELEAGLAAYYNGMKQSEQVAEEPTPWWIPQFVVDNAQELLNSIPSLSLSEGRQVVPIIKLPANLLTIGTVTSYSTSAKFNPNISWSSAGPSTKTPAVSYGPLSTYFSMSNSGMTIKVSMDGFYEGLSVNIKNPSLNLTAGFVAPVDLQVEGYNPEEFETQVGYSLNANFQLNNGYDATIGLDLYTADVTATTPLVNQNIKTGGTIEMNVWVATALVLALVFTPVDELVAAGGALIAGASGLIKGAIDLIQNLPFPLPTGQ